MTKKNYFIPNQPANFVALRDAVIDGVESLVHPPESIRIASMPIFDQAIGGLRPREFTILCGSTGVGKTTFIANLSAELVNQQTPHLVASVETGHLDFFRRVASVWMQQDLNTGEPVSAQTIKELSRSHFSKLNSAYLQLALYENRTTVESLMHDMITAHEKFGTKIAIIDNLNFFMEVTRSADTLIEMDRVIHELIIFCKQVDMHVIMIMHPKKNAANARDTRVESEFEIKGSSLAVQEAHNVFLLNRPRQEDVDSGSAHPTDREIKIAKMRRRGLSVGKRFLFECKNSVSYTEKGMVSENEFKQSDNANRTSSGSRKSWGRNFLD